MENRKTDLQQEMSKRKAEKGIENMEFIYQQLQDSEHVEEKEDEEVGNEEKKN